MSELQRAAVMAGAALLAAVVVYPPLWRGVASRQARLRELQARTAEAQRATAEQAAHARQLEGAKQRFAPLARRVGAGQSMARVLEALNEHAQQHKLPLTAVQPRAEAAAPRVVGGLALREVPLEVQVTGRYRQIGEFLGGLSEAPFLATVRTLTLTAPEDLQALEARMVLVVLLEERL